MLRDRNCDKNFERSLMYQINKAKIAARKMHNARMTDYNDPKSENDFHDAMVEIVAIAFTIEPKQPVTFCHGFILSTI